MKNREIDSVFLAKILDKYSLAFAQEHSVCLA